jgi:hypothetical protein
MYTNVMKWDWGNSDTTKNISMIQKPDESITYRTNLARLMDQLIVERKFEKAKTIIDL